MDCLALLSEAWTPFENKKHDINLQAHASLLNKNYWIYYATSWTALTDSVLVFQAQRCTLINKSYL